MIEVPTIALIVEGHGEVQAAPVLVRRIASEVFETGAQVDQPFRLDSGKMRRGDELAKAIRFMSRRVSGQGGVLVLRDGDDKDIDCPVDLARKLAPEPGLVDVPVEIVVARREYEAWFLAGINSLVGHTSISADAAYDLDPEECRDAKGRLGSLMVESYKETRHQVKFSAMLDIGLAMERSRSLRRLVHAVELLLP